MSNQYSLLEPERHVASVVPREVRGDDHAFLRSTAAEPWLTEAHSPRVRVVDLFSGCGGMSLGVREACGMAGVGFETALAADMEETALAVYRDNFKPVVELRGDLSLSFSRPVGAPLTSAERSIQDRTGVVDILIGGPPCQGHSDLNNFARRDDPKNALYGVMGRAAEVLGPKHVIIENVLGARHDKARVVQDTQDRLEGLGYHTALTVLDGVVVGIPQRRRRLFLIGSRSAEPKPFSNFPIHPARDLRWAIGDLEDRLPSVMLDRHSIPSSENKRRIDYLFENDVYDLPDSLRPPCHRDKRHTYRSVYGRLAWDAPAQTVTSGFYSMCMGRYVHPSRRRTLTAHEAARLQFFPDFFDFSSAKSRTALATLIGNAVPPKFAFLAALTVLEEVQTPAIAMLAGERS